MSLKPPSLWIEKRGRQHRVYWRNASGQGLPARSYQRFYSRADADQFVSMVAYFGLKTARQVMATEDVAVWRALLDTVGRAGLAPAVPGPTSVPAPLLPATGPTTATARPHGSPADSRLAGVSFRRLWETFLERQRHLDEGSASLYAGYGCPPNASTPEALREYQLRKLLNR